MRGDFFSNLEDGSAHLHTSRIVVKIFLWRLLVAVMQSHLIVPALVSSNSM